MSLLSSPLLTLLDDFRMGLALTALSITVIVLLDAAQVYHLRRASSKEQNDRARTRFRFCIEAFAWLTIGCATGTVLRLPSISTPVRSTLKDLLGPLAGTGSSIAVAYALGLLIIILETLPVMRRTVRRMQVLGIVLGVLKVLATAAASTTLIMLRADQLWSRNVVLANLVFCGGLTFWRQFRRRWSSGDRSAASLSGGIQVVSQFLSLLVLMGALVAGALTIFAWPVFWLERRPDISNAWIVIFACMCTLFSACYLAMYLLRRLSGGRGLSWFDPVMYRVLIKDTNYRWMGKRLDLKRTFPFACYSSGDFVNTMRETYIQYVVGDSGDNVAAAIDQAAKVMLPGKEPDSIRFTIIGDPGEGDDSQLYEIRKHRALFLQEAVGGAASRHSKDSLQQRGAKTKNSDPDFVIISSDVIYPAGELMDYERAVYRPYRFKDPEEKLRPPDGSVPIYGFPGNHDWYDNLKGFFANFTYAAACDDTTEDAGVARRLQRGPWASYGWPSGKLRWNQVRGLRQKYGLLKLGGVEQVPATHQRLPFLELQCDGVPLTILCIDSGCNGSVDSLQYGWIDRALQRATEQNYLKFVLMSEPLYVNGAFDDRGDHKRIYRLFRKHKVDVVMAGDTHTYQRYEAKYTVDGQRYTMYHIVNGGGGAYLSSPMDSRWQQPFRYESVRRGGNSGMRIDPQVVYHDDMTGPDEIILRDLFPTSEHMRMKFGTRNERRWDSPTGGWVTRRVQWLIEPILLKHGYTNFLEHDRPPLLQSVVEGHMYKSEEGWKLVLAAKRGRSPAEGDYPCPVNWPAFRLEIPSRVAQACMPAADGG